MNPAPSNLLACSASMLVSTACAARAAGLDFPDLGAPAVGRGGAAVASPSGGAALQLNPAALAAQAGWCLSLEGRLLAQPVHFATVQGDRVDNLDPWQVAPGLAVLSYGWGAVGPFTGLTVAAGVLAPSAAQSMQYPPQGAQRYALIGRNTPLWYDSVAVAAQLGTQLRLGITLQALQGYVRLQQAVRPFSGNAPALDVLSTFEAWQQVRITGVFGVTYMPHPLLALGLSYRPRMSLQADGTLNTQLPAGSQNTGVAVHGNRASLQAALPHVVRLGAQLQPHPDWQVEVAAVYESWSVLQSLRLQPHAIVLTTTAGTQEPLPVMNFPKDLHDTWSLRAGGAWAALPERLLVRAGAGFESSAFPSSTVSLDYPNWGTWLLSVGGSVRLWNAWIDLAYAYQGVPNQQVSDSRVQQQVTPSITGGVPATPQIVGNGTYQTQRHLLMLGVRLAWGVQESL